MKKQTTRLPRACPTMVINNHHHSEKEPLKHATQPHLVSPARAPSPRPRPAERPRRRSHRRRQNSKKCEPFRSPSPPPRPGPVPIVRSRRPVPSPPPPEPPSHTRGAFLRKKPGESRRYRRARRLVVERRDAESCRFARALRPGPAGGTRASRSREPTSSTNRAPSSAPLPLPPTPRAVSRVPLSPLHARAAFSPARSGARRRFVCCALVGCPTFASSPSVALSRAFASVRASSGARS